MHFSQSELKHMQFQFEMCRLTVTSLTRAVYVCRYTTNIALSLAQFESINARTKLMSID